MYLIGKLSYFLAILTILIQLIGSATSEQKSQSLSGLLNIIKMSSGHGEPTVNKNGQRSTKNLYMTSRLGSASTRTPNSDDDFETDSDSSGGSSSETDLPDPIFLAKTQIHTQIQTAQDRETTHLEMQELRKEEIKYLLLQKLQLDRLPKPNMTNLYRRFPAHLLRHQNEGLQMDAPARTDNYHIKIQRMIRFSQQSKFH